jgi:hypothetical protein
MKPERRRILNMGAVIGAGTVLILFDAPPLLLIFGSVAVGFLVLMLTGSIRISRKRSAELPKKEVKSADKGISVSTSTRRKEAPAPESKSRPIKRRSIREVLAPLSSLWKKEKMPPDPDEKVKKIDQMLDTLIAEAPAPAPVAAEQKATPQTGSPPTLGIAPLKDLSNAQLEDDLLIPDPEDDKESAGAEESIATLDLASSEAVTLDADSGTDEVENILKAYEGELEGLGSLGEMELSDESLGGIDLEAMNLEIEEEPAVQKRDPAPAGKPSATIENPPAPNPRPSPPVTEKGPDMVAFAAGSPGGDDFLAALKTDVSQVRKPKDLSLLRGMKDERPEARDLEDELQQFSEQLKVKLAHDNTTARQG